MSRPSVSVVVASGAGGEFLFRCLASLRAQAQQFGAEILVVDRVGPATRERVAREFPDVRVLAAPADHRATVPEMRRIGAENARGDIVAVLEEHCTAPDRWIETIATNFRSDDAAIGGPILDDEFERVRDWVVYFSEYHNFMPPWPDGERLALNGANVAYDRAKLLAHRDVLDTGYWEVVLHPRLAKDGKFRAVDAMGAFHTGPFDFGYYLHQRYLLSRVWGGTQKDRVGLPVRVAHIVLAPVFPFVMLARIKWRVLQGKRLLMQYVAATPMLFVAMCALTLGETLGYLLGPGSALEEVE
jgi:glycosyltransferase involved in cell wall biosynthesis